MLAGIGIGIIMAGLFVGAIFGARMATKGLIEMKKSGQLDELKKEFYAKKTENSSKPSPSVDINRPTTVK